MELDLKFDPKFLICLRNSIYKFLEYKVKDGYIKGNIVECDNKRIEYIYDHKKKEMDEIVSSNNENSKVLAFSSGDLIVKINELNLSDGTRLFYHNFFVDQDRYSIFFEEIKPDNQLEKEFSTVLEINKTLH
jgi:DNA-binding GntR family transcriptional regulator